MKSELIDHYFPRGLAWTVLVATCGLSVYLIGWSQSYGWPLFFVILNSAIFTPTYVTSVDPRSKIILDQFSIFWIPVRSQKQIFNQLHGIEIDKQRQTYRANQRARDRVADFNQYVGALKFDNTSLELSRETDFQPFMERMTKMANQLNIPLTRLF